MTLPPLVRALGHKFSATGMVVVFCLGAVPALADIPVTPQQQSDAANAPVGGLTMQAVGSEIGSYSSNPLMTTTGSHKALWGSTTTPELIVNDVTPTWNLGADTTVDENIFNQSSFNSTDVHENASLFHQSELWKIGSGGHIDYDTTRTSELSDFGFNNVVSRHLGLSASPQISYAPTAVDDLSLTGGVQQSTYDSSLFTGYDTYTATPAYSHRFDPSNTGILEVQAQRYQTITGPSRRLDSIGPSVGWQTVFTPRLSADVAVGAQTARQYNGSTPASPWNWDYTFSADLNFKGVLDDVKLSAQREQAPYGNGSDSLQSSYGLTGSHNLNQVFTVNYDASYITSDYQVTTPGSINNLTSAGGGLTYHATEHLDISATYEYRYETLTSGGGTATDHSALLTLSYRPKEWTL